MPPKKGKGGKKKGKKGKKGVLGADPDDYKSFNIDQRGILLTLFANMRKNQEENNKVRHDLKESLNQYRSLHDNYVSLTPSVTLNIFFFIIGKCK